MYCRSIRYTSMLWGMLSVLTVLVWLKHHLRARANIHISEHVPRTTTQHFSVRLLIFWTFLRCLDQFEQITSPSSFAGEVWFQQDHSGNVHQRPRQGADAFNEVCVLLRWSQLWLRQRCWACFLEPPYLLWFFGCWAKSGELKEPW